MICQISSNLRGRLLVPVLFLGCEKIYPLRNKTPNAPVQRVKYMWNSISRDSCLTLFLYLYLCLVLAQSPFWNNEVQEIVYAGVYIFGDWGFCTGGILHQIHPCSSWVMPPLYQAYLYTFARLCTGISHQVHNYPLWQLWAITPTPPGLLEFPELAK